MTLEVVATAVAIVFWGAVIYEFFKKDREFQRKKLLANASQLNSDDFRMPLETQDQVDDLKLFLDAHKHDYSFFTQIYSENYNFSQLEAIAHSSDVANVDRANFDYLLDLAKSNYKKVADQYRECSETAIVAMSICQMKEDLEREITTLEKQILSLESNPAN